MCTALTNIAVFVFRLSIDYAFGRTTFANEIGGFARPPSPPQAHSLKYAADTARKLGARSCEGRIDTAGYRFKSNAKWVADESQMCSSNWGRRFVVGSFGLKFALFLPALYGVYSIYVFDFNEYVHDFPYIFPNRKDADFVCEYEYPAWCIFDTNIVNYSPLRAASDAFGGGGGGGCRRRRCCQPRRERSFFVCA